MTTDPTSEPTAVEERVARHLAARDWLTDEDRWTNSTAAFRADYLTAAREVIALVQQPAAAPASSPPADRTALRDRIAEGIRAAACPGNCGKTEEECREERIQPFVWHHGKLAIVEGSPEQLADAVLAVLPEPADRAAVLREAAAAIEKAADEHPDYYVPQGLYDAAERLRRMAGETPAAEEPPADRAVLDRVREIVRRLDAHAVGFQDVLDDSDRDPWAKTVRADIAALRRLADETPAATERVKHSGPDTKFCALCLSGEHERVAAEAQPAPTPPPA